MTGANGQFESRGIGDLADAARSASIPSWRAALPSQRRIAVVGSAPDSRGLAPYDDPSWQIWVVNNMPLTGPGRFDAVFQLHGKPANEDEHRWLAANTETVVFLRDECPYYPRAIRYPREVVLKAFGRYFTNSVSWMLALAILCEPEEIGVWGVNMAQASEYAHQRPSCEFFLGVAKGRGIKLTLPAESDLLKARTLYAVEEQDPMRVKLAARRKELQERLARAAAERDRLHGETLFLQGALEEANYWSQWG